MYNVHTIKQLGGSEVAELYKVSQVAEQFKVSKRTVERWIKSGELKTVYLPGRLVRISSDDIMDMICSGEESE